VITLADGASPFEVARVGGVPFQAATLEEASDWVLRAAASGDALNVRLANAFNVALADKHPSYKQLLSSAGVNFPDGTPVVWAINFMRNPAGARRVRGPSLFVRTLEKSVPLGTRHYLLGGSPETLMMLERNVRAMFPGVVIVGAYSPPFEPVTEQYVNDCASRVRGSAADIVWVGLGTPKQDVLGTALASEAAVLTVNVGAAFDFVAGTIKEPPRWVQNSGFEWLHRLITEPRRLWKRYLFGNSRFIWAVVKNRKLTRVRATA